MIKNRDISECIAIDGGCALHLIDEAPHASIVFSENKNAYCVSMESGVIDESPYPSIKIF